MAPTVRLAFVSDQAASALMEKPAPGILVSYAYIRNFKKHRKRLIFRDYALDSGAFTAFASGTPVDLGAYIEMCKELMKTDDQLAEIFALDVIGDWRASLKNTERMWEAGVPAIPCFHHSEPLDTLKHMARTYPKLALGGVARKRSDYKMAWAEWAFSHVWPKKLHGFGFGSERQIMGFPWHSVDASTWEYSPSAFGRWMAYGKMSVRGKKNFRSEVLHYLDIEKKAGAKWKEQMKEIGE